MKKICAVLCSVIMAAAVMTACGDSSSASKSDASAAVSAAESTAESKAEESKAEESKAEESKAEESKAEESKAEESTAEAEGEWGPLGKAYTEKLASGVYTLDMTVKTSLTGETPMLLEVNGNDRHMKLTTMGVEMETYLIDGKTYNILASLNAYTVSTDGDDTSETIQTYGLTPDMKLADSGEQDGLKFEKYVVSFGDEADSSNDVTTTYYFDADGNIKKISADAPILGETEAVVNSVKFDDVKIELPDLSGMTEMNGDLENSLSNEDRIKMTMSMLGITEDMVTKSGYTMEGLAAMDENAIGKTLVQIAKDNGLELGSLLGGLEGSLNADSAGE